MDVRGNRKKNRGQTTVEYILLVAFGAIFSMQVVGFLNGIFKDGLLNLEGNVEIEARTGEAFTK